MKAKRPAKRRRSLCFFYIAGLFIPVALLLALASALLRDTSGESPALMMAVLTEEGKVALQTA